jgi:hypothetical protein
MKEYCGSGSIAPRIFGLGTSCRWVVSFTLRPLYRQGKSPWYPLDRRLGGTQSRSGRGGEEKIPRPCRDSNPDHPTSCPALYHWAIPALEVSGSVQNGREGVRKLCTPGEWSSLQLSTLVSVITCVVSATEMWTTEKCSPSFWFSSSRVYLMYDLWRALIEMKWD